MLDLQDRRYIRNVYRALCKHQAATETNLGKEIKELKDDVDLVPPLSVLFGGLAVAGTLTLGPIDFARTVYNQLVGDTVPIKYELVDYTRRGVQRRDSTLSPSQIEEVVATILNTKPDETGRVNPLMVSSSNLWDATEELAPSKFERYVWPRLR